MENINRKLALSQLLSCSLDEIEEGDRAYAFIVKDAEYLVMTDDEADKAWEERLDNYIEEYIMPMLPENLQCYFDKEAWKADAKHDGRGHSLSSYDGNEYEESVDDEDFYIYRIN